MTGFNPGSGKQLDPGLVATHDLHFTLFGHTIDIPFGAWNGAWRGTWYEAYNGVHAKYFANASDLLCGSTAITDNRYLDKLREEGYDVIILMNDIGMSYVEDNAALLIQLIKDINYEKMTNGFYFENIVCGYSAGALASRLALSMMESRYKVSHNFWDHPHTKMWISFEGEHQGNGVPIGFQHLIDFQANPLNMLYSGPEAAADNLNQLVAGLSLFFNDSPISRQITKYHSLVPSDGPCPERLVMLGLFAAIWDNHSNGYPEFCRRVGVSQGSSLGINVPHTTDMFNSNLLSGLPDRTGTSVLASSSCAQNYTVYMPHGDKTTIARYWGASTGSSPVFYGNSSFDSHFTYFPMTCSNVPVVGCRCTPAGVVGVNIVFARRTIHKPLLTSNFDDVPGSTLAAQLQLYDNSAYNAFGTTILPTASIAVDQNLHRMVPTVSALDLHDPAHPGNNFIDPVSLGLMQINPLTQNPTKNFGFPFLNHPFDHFNITPFDAIYGIGTDKGQHTDFAPKPANQFHVEDPLSSIGSYLANVEVAPEILYLSNRNLAATMDDYPAEFEAREKIYVGNGIYGLDNNVNYLTRDGDFNVDGHSFCKLHAPDIIALTAGTSVSPGAQLSAYIQDYNCPDFLRMAYVSTGNENNESNSETKTESENEIKKDKEIKSDIKLKVYPNPGNGMFIVENKNEDANSNLIISDLTGKVIFPNQLLTINQMRLICRIWKTAFIL